MLENSLHYFQLTFDAQLTNLNIQVKIKGIVDSIFRGKSGLFCSL